MSHAFLNIFLAFFEGLALIASPCILPVLPIVLSGSLVGGKSRPLGIILGFILTFACFTLFSRIIVSSLHVNQNILQDVSYFILILFGIIMISETLATKFYALTAKFSNIGNDAKIANDSQGGFWSGVLFGGLVGIIWTPCAGPILAIVIVQSILQHTNIESMLTILAFACGAAIPMMLITYFGRAFIDKFKIIKEHTQLIRKILGVVIIISIIMIMFFPTRDINNRIVLNDSAATQLENALASPYPEPQIDQDSQWINSAPLQLSQLKGKVVLIDFWTYSCINCIRTLPYLKAWYQKYHDKGFVIIGVHSPEFLFEHNIANVTAAVKRFGIKYPVVLDNNFKTWLSFNNRYWPAHYLIDKNGNVVYEHFGEGEYDVTENNIRYLLNIHGATVAAKSAQRYSDLLTPETYLGYARASQFVNQSSVTQNVAAQYSYPDTLLRNQWALQGEWIIYSDKIVAQSAGAKIKLHFNAGTVFAVLGNSGSDVKVNVYLNGQLISKFSGSDVIDGGVDVTSNRLYSIIDLKKVGAGVVELEATQPGLEIYTFTFGD